MNSASDPIALLRQALAGSPVTVSLIGSKVVFENGDMRYRFPPDFYHRIDAFVYGVRLASGLYCFENEVIWAVVELEKMAFKARMKAEENNQ